MSRTEQTRTDDQRHLVLLAEGGSMQPLSPPGSRLVVERCSPAVLHPGDIVAVRRGDRTVVHRLLGRAPDGSLLCKGDTARVPDPPLPPDRLIGMVIAIERRHVTIDLRSLLARAYGLAMVALAPVASPLALALGPVWRAVRPLVERL